MRGEEVNDEHLSPADWLILVKGEITTNHNFSPLTTFLARAFVHGMASPAIACIGVIGKYVRVLYALIAMQ
jgi:hypothetical protein